MANSCYSCYVGYNGYQPTNCIDKIEFQLTVDACLVVLTSNHLTEEYFGVTSAAHCLSQHTVTEWQTKTKLKTFFSYKQ